MDEITQIFLSAMFGGIVGSIATIMAARWNTLVNLKSAQERLQLQLLHEDKKKALKELSLLVNKSYLYYDEFEKAVLSFFESFEADFLPVELKRAIKTEFDNLHKFLQDSNLEPPPASENEINLWLKGYEEYFKNLPSEEQAKEEYKQKLGNIKNFIKSLIQQYIKP